MLKATMRSRTLHEPGVAQMEVEEAIEGLLQGGKVVDLDSRLCKSVITTLTHMRKNAILQKREVLAAKMAEILGELEHGPSQFNLTVTAEPAKTRSLAVDQLRPLSANAVTKAFVRGAKLEETDSGARQDAVPVLKQKLAREQSRTHYAKGGVVADVVDHIAEFGQGSRRLGPKLLKVRELRAKLDAARESYAAARQRARDLRQRYEEIEQDAALKLGERLDGELLDYGSHVPTSLPLEFAKLGSKTLDAQVRQWKASRFCRWDDADAFRGEALDGERTDLEASSQRFARSHKLQRTHVLSQQKKKRGGFADLWQRKREVGERQLSKELGELRSTIEHYERLLGEAEGSAGGELARIRTSEQARAGVDHKV